MSKLYHFTAGDYLRAISQHGLTVGDVPTDIWAHKGKIGVWFTSSDKPTGHGLRQHCAVIKTRFRLTVDVPDDKLIKWTDWSAVNVTSETRAALRGADGAGEDSWYVYFGRVEPARVTEVFDLSTGAVVPDWGTFWPEFGSLPGVSYEKRFRWQKRLMSNVRRAIQADMRQELELRAQILRRP